MKTASELAAELARKFGGDHLDGLVKKEEPKPKAIDFDPDDARNRATGIVRTRVRSSDDLYFPPGKSRAVSSASSYSGDGKYIQAGCYSITRGYMFDAERDALGDRPKARPSRPVQRLSQWQWDKLADHEVTRDMDFDRWIKSSGANLEPMVRGFDPDYEPAARLYLAKKREAHTK